MKLPDLLCLQDTPANPLDIPEISTKEETCQIFSSKSTSDNKHRQFWWFPADNISPLAAGCESFTLSSSITLFFIHLLRRPGASELFSHMWLLSQLKSDGVARMTEAFVKGGKRGWMGEKLCLAWMWPQTTAHYSETKITSRKFSILFFFNVNCCLVVHILLVTITLLPSPHRSVNRKLPGGDEALKGRLLCTVSLLLLHQKVDVCSLWGSPGRTDEAHSATHNQPIRVFTECCSSSLKETTERCRLSVPPKTRSSNLQQQISIGLNGK